MESDRWCEITILAAGREVLRNCREVSAAMPPSGGEIANNCLHVAAHGDVLRASGYRMNNDIFACVCLLESARWPCQAGIAPVPMPVAHTGAMAEGRGGRSPRPAEAVRPVRAFFPRTGIGWRGIPHSGEIHPTAKTLQEDAA